MKGIKQINNYKFISEIGKGTASKVYLAINEKNNELLAIKQISMEKITDKNSMENFIRELKILNSFNNENIIKILGIEKTKNNIYLLLEYCNGGNLLEYKKFYENYYKTQINEIYIQKILKQLINGLEYMHNKKVIHRDIKLENIVINFSKYPKKLKDKNEILKPIKLEETSLNEDFQIKIADLGYAKDLSIDLTASTFCGTPITMAPETMDNQFNDHKYNTKADLWSLGAITYELLIGQPPFYENNIKGLMEKIKNGTYTLPKNKKISLEIISFINGLLQLIPEKRMNWEQIKKHPFINTKPENFNYINLETINDNNNNKNIEININNLDNYLWLNFKKNDNLNINFDKINENVLKEPKFKKIIEENKIENKEILKIIDNEINKEKEKFQIKENEMKIKLDLLEKQKNEINDENLKLKNENLKIKKNVELIEKKYEEQQKILDNELKNNIVTKLKMDLQNKYFDLDELKINLEQNNSEEDKNSIIEEKKKIEKEIKKIKNQIKKHEKLKKIQNEFELIDSDNEWEEIEDDEVNKNQSKIDFESLE